MAVFFTDERLFFLALLRGSVGVCYVIRGFRNTEGARYTHG